jgi:flavin reductase (DIM6/NTAB) family NADH-FMN oxidoreductase RutF
MPGHDAARNIFKPEALREVLGLYPTGITVVTTKTPDGGLYGVTANSFSSVSLDPPLVLFSLSRKLRTLGALLEAKSFAIHFLREDQRHVSARFAHPHSNKWEDTSYRFGISGSPILDAAAVLECELYEQHDGGDHIIVVGRVAHMERGPNCRTLVYYRGRYHTLGGETQ